MKYGGMLTSIQVMESLVAEAGRADSETSRNDRMVIREAMCRFMLIFFVRLLQDKDRGASLCY